MGVRFRAVNLNMFLKLMLQETDGTVYVFRDGGDNKIVTWDSNIHEFVPNHVLDKVNNSLAYGDIVVFNPEGTENFIITGA